MKKCYILAITIISLAVSVSCLANTTEVEISIQLYSGDQRASLRKIARTFEQQHPGISIKWSLFRKNYINNVDDWLTQQDGPDLIYWYGGKRIAHYAKQGLVQDIDTLWKAQNLDDAFPVVISNAIKYKNKAYAIPVTYYLILMHYHQDRLVELGIKEPKTWDELISACHKLKKNNISLFSVGSKTKWTLHAWFDYLNLRIHGLDFYRRLLDGEIPFDDERVKQVFRYWLILLNNGCVNENHASLNLEQAFPRVVHGLSAFALTDSSPTRIALKDIMKDLRVIEFPTINSDIPNYTVSPVNTFLVPSYTVLTDDIKKVLLYLSSKNVQTRLNENTDHLSAHLHSNEQANFVLKQKKNIMTKSPGGIQYFDRDMDIEFAKLSPHIFFEFLQHRNIDRITKELESLRQKVFHKK